MLPRSPRSPWKIPTGQHEDVERNPKKVSGAWIVKNTRLPVDAILIHADEYTPEEIATEIFDGYQTPCGGSSSSQGSMPCILLDTNMLTGLRAVLSDHEVVSAPKMGWGAPEKRRASGGCRG